MSVDSSSVKCKFEVCGLYICMYMYVCAYVRVCIGRWMYNLGTRLCTGLVLVCCLYLPHHKMATAAKSKINVKSPLEHQNWAASWVKHKSIF